MAVFYEKDDDPVPNLTMCSTMFCYNWVIASNDPTKPPFCLDCKAKNRGKNMKVVKGGTDGSETGV